MTVSETIYSEIKQYGPDTEFIFKIVTKNTNGIFVFIENLSSGNTLKIYDRTKFINDDGTENIVEIEKINESIDSNYSTIFVPTIDEFRILTTEPVRVKIKQV